VGVDPGGQVVSAQGATIVMVAMHIILCRICIVIWVPCVCWSAYVACRNSPTLLAWSFACSLLVLVAIALVSFQLGTVSFPMPSLTTLETRFVLLL
jgi:hypothetical protein